MILSRCPITGIELRIDSSFSGRIIKVSALHPMLHAEVSQLAQVQPQSTKDSSLLMTALLFKLHELEFLDFRGTPKLSEHWIKQELPHLQTFVQWASNAVSCTQKDSLPILRMDTETSEQNLQAWRQECQSIASTWDTMLDAALARHIRREREAALALLNTPAHLQSKIAKSPRVARVQARLSFVRDALESYTEHGPSLIDLYVKILATPHTYEVVQLQRAKECFLDYLPDKTIEDYNDKDTCLRILDAAIMEKVGLANMLGIGMSPESQEIADNIRTENSVFADGRRFNASADQRTQSAMQFLESRRESNIAELHVPDVEPKREDFPSNLGYQVALRLWTKAQENK